MTVLNQLTVFDEYTRHEEMAIPCLTTSPIGNKIKKWNIRYNLTLYCNSHAYSVLDEYTRHGLFFHTFQGARNNQLVNVLD